MDTAADCLSRNSDLAALHGPDSRLADDLRVGRAGLLPECAALLERMRSAVEAQLASRGGIALQDVSQRARRLGWRAKPEKARRRAVADAGAERSIFPNIRKKLGPNLRALICGSAPLARGDAAFFQMLGIPVLQVYGLTETTAICTMDDPAACGARRRGPGDSGHRDEAGRERRNSGARAEYFSGLLESAGGDRAKALASGWFHTGDQGELNAGGKLAHHRAAEKFADSEFGPQHRAGAD